MKTYWLEKKKNRPKLTKGIIIQEPPQWIARAPEKRSSASSISYNQRSNLESLNISRKESRVSSPTLSVNVINEDRRMYSPITYQDVARRSVTNSPTKITDARGNVYYTVKQWDKVDSMICRYYWHFSELRSNSVGTANFHNPSDIFGSLISETEEHFRLHRDSLSSRDYSTGAYGKPDLKITTVASCSLDDTKEEKANKATSSEARGKVKGNVEPSQVHLRSDQCCAGLTMTKSGKLRHQNSSCNLFWVENTTRFLCDLSYPCNKQTNIGQYTNAWLMVIFYRVVQINWYD